MAVPARRLILQNLATTLAGITTGNGYKTTVVKVETVARSFADTVVSEKPWVGIYPQRESLVYEHSGSIRVTLTCLLICHIAGDTVDDRASTLNDLLDDVIGVLGVDTTRGANAVMTRLTSVETDEGDPDAYGHGSMVIHSEVVYFRTDTSS